MPKTVVLDKISLQKVILINRRSGPTEDTWTIAISYIMRNPTNEIHASRNFELTGQDKLAAEQFLQPFIDKVKQDESIEDVENWEDAQE